MPFYYKLLAVSVCVIVLAVILYFVPGGRIRIPAMVFCALACFMAGIGVGVIGMYSFGFHWEREPQVSKRSMGGGGGPGGGPGGGSGGGETKKGGDGAGSKGEDKKEGDPGAKNGSEK
jgi:uncharacterized membrane protein YgcG